MIYYSSRVLNSGGSSPRIQGHHTEFRFVLNAAQELGKVSQEFLEFAYGQHVRCSSKRYSLKAGRGETVRQ
jgi:hypothetical protein